MFNRLSTQTEGMIRAVAVQIAVVMRRFDGMIAQCINVYKRSTPHVTWRPYVFEAADGVGYGGLVVYCAKRHVGQAAMIKRYAGDYSESDVIHSPVDEHTTTKVGSFYAAYFPRLLCGCYVVYEPGRVSGSSMLVTVTARACAEVRFR